MFAVLLLLFARHAGDGPLHECCHSLMLANRANGSPATGDGASASAGGVGGEKRAADFGEALPVSKPTPTPTAVEAATAADADAPHHYPEEEALPLPQVATATGTATGEQQQQQQSMSPPPYDQLPPANV